MVASHFFGPSGRPGQPVSIDGQLFPTMTAAAVFAGVSVPRIHALCQRVGKRGGVYHLTSARRGRGHDPRTV